MHEKLKIIKKEFIDDYKKYLFEEEKLPSTIYKYTHDIFMFAKWLNGKKIEKATVMEYKEKINSVYASRSVNSILSSLNSFFIFMNWHGLKVKTLKIQRHIFSDKSKELSKSEYERLLTAADSKKNKQLYYLIQTIASTGLRVSEIKYVTCEAVKKGQAVINCKGKIRQIFFPCKLCKILKEYIRIQNIKSGAVFISKRGKPLDRSNIWKMLKALCDSADVDKSKVFPHNLRHLFARTFYSLQKDIVRLADILGHSSIETTRIYTTESGEEHMKQLQKLGLLRC